MSQIHKVSMPKWGMEMTEGTVAEWHVAEGDSIQADDDLVDIETSKIVNTVTAPVAGVVRRILTQPGSEYPVGTALCLIADSDIADADIEQFANDLGAAKAADPEADPPQETPAAPKQPSSPPRNEEPRLASVPAPSSAPAGGKQLEALGQGDDDSTVAATPIARRLAAHYRVNLNNVAASGRYGRVTKADLEQAVTAAGGKLIDGPAPMTAETPRPAGQGDDAVAATPVARRLARELNINLLDCRASGTRGRVSKADVEARAALMGRATGSQPAGTGEPEAPAFEEKPLSGMRKTIAARLQSSKQTAPHFRVQVDASIDQLLALRKSLNEARPDAKISVNDFIIKAAACALVQVPDVNVQFDGENLRHFRDADIAVAVALDEGLITPIVRKANRKGLVEISNEVRDLATRAKLGRLSAEEFQGGTFSISNLGMFGVKQFDAIINPPQGAILAVGAAEPRPVLVDGSWQAASVMTLSLSSDHRIIDGALAAKFLSVLRGFLEQPGTMLG